MTGMRMTRDEVRELIGETMRDVFGYADGVDFTHPAEAVLAAFAARGIVLGTDPKINEMEEIDLAHEIHLGMRENAVNPQFNALDRLTAKLPAVGLALVRIVTND